MSENRACPFVEFRSDFSWNLIQKNIVSAADKPNKDGITPPFAESLADLPPNLLYPRKPHLERSFPRANPSIALYSELLFRNEYTLSLSLPSLWRIANLPRESSTSLPPWRQLKANIRCHKTNGRRRRRIGDHQG